MRKPLCRLRATGILDEIAQAPFDDKRRARLIDIRRGTS
jgi:hypothetical protein